MSNEGDHGRPLLEVEGLTVEFPAPGGPMQVVRGSSFTVSHGECLAIVGESGSGKSMTARAIIDLVPSPGRIAAGSIRFDGEDVLALSRRQQREFRGAQVSMVFQDPTATLNPLFTVGRHLVDAFRSHNRVSRGEAERHALKVLDQVGMPGAEERLHTYPFELSGGLRQRVSIALALLSDPRLVIADEPTTNLDVSVQAQIIDLLLHLKEESGFAIIVISHDLGVVANIADRVMVMYSGRAVESGDTYEVLANPRHPYTNALLSCVPTLEHSIGGDPLPSIDGMAPSPAEVGLGCPFAPRCPVVIDGLCEHEDPPWVPSGEGRSAACHLVARDETRAAS